MDKKTTTIVAVVIVVVVAIAVYSIMNDDSDNVEKEDVKYVFEDNDSYLLKVFGNANGDNAIDSKDVEVINNLLKGSIDYDKTKHSYADANQDGAITSEDATYIQGIIDKNTSVADRIFYYDVNGDVASVSQPVKKLGADYWPCMDGIVVLGAQDILTHVDSGIYGQLSSNAVKYKGFGQDKVTNFGSGFGSNYDFETIVENSPQSITF